MMKIFNKNKNKSFTLIELLVVIAIIGLLSTIVFVALDNSRKKARDARRMSDLKQLQTAIEIYLDDNNGTLPFPQNYGERPADSYYDESVVSVDGDAIKFMDFLFDSGIVKQDVVDPVNNSQNHYWYYTSTNTCSCGYNYYMVLTVMENDASNTGGSSTPCVGCYAGCTTCWSSGRYYGLPLKFYAIVKKLE